MLLVEQHVEMTLAIADNVFMHSRRQLVLADSPGHLRDDSGRIEATTSAMTSRN